MRPLFDYCDSIYDGHLTISDELRLERLQNRAARLVTGALPRTSTNKLRQELGWDRLQTRRKIHRLTLYRQLQADETSIPDYIRSMIPSVREHSTGRALRNQNQHTVPYSRTCTYQRSFIPNTSRQWNMLPRALRSCKESKQFKQNITLLYSSPQPSHYFTLGKKLGNALHTQLRLGMSKLNAHQYSIQKVTNPACVCGYRLENTKHFLLHCPLFTLLRCNLFQYLDLDIDSLPDSTKIGTLINGYHMTKHTSFLVSAVFQSFLEKTLRLS